MGCRCGKSKGLRITTTTTTVRGPGVTTDGGVRFALKAAGQLRTFPTELEAKAARARAGEGKVFPL